jgi:type IV secretion system protein VirD4
LPFYAVSCCLVKVEAGKVETTGPFEWAVLGSAGAVWVVGGVLWLSGQLGGRLTSGHWLPMPVSSVPGLAFAVARHPSTPRMAWPASARGLLPSTAALYGLSAAIAVVVALVVTGLVVTTWHGLAGAGRTADRGAPITSRWARRRDLATLRVRSTVAGRLTFGNLCNRRRLGPLLAGEARSSLIVLGPSQSGKTSGLAIPAILEWAGPVVATSVKADLARDTIKWRRSLGPVWVFDPTSATGLPRAWWNPVARCGDWRVARQVAAWLCAAARTRPGGMGDDDFWYAAAAKLLAPHLLAAAIGRRDIADVVRWIDVQDQDEVGELLDRAGVAEASRAAMASWERDERTRSSIYATAEMVLEAFADPVVAASAGASESTCPSWSMSPSAPEFWSEIRADELVAGQSSTLYICAPSHEQDRLHPVFATLIHEVLAAAIERASRLGGPLDPPLLLVLDEAANIAPIRDLDGLASTAAGYGVQLVTVFQDLAQIQARYAERAATVVNNHRAKIVLSGVSDPATLDYASKIIGEAEIGESSVTTDRRGGRSTTRAVRERRLLTDAQLRRLRPQEGVLIYAHLQPTRLRLRPWFTDSILRRRAVLPRAPMRRESPGSWRSPSPERTA